MSEINLNEHDELENEVITLIFIRKYDINGTRSHQMRLYAQRLQQDTSSNIYTIPRWKSSHNSVK